jgi:SAM-dependent methyltransferase
LLYGHGMHVVDLRDFYTTPLGRAVTLAIAARLSRLGVAKSRQVVMGLGFALPFLPGVTPDDATSLAFMPAKQGVIHWPADGANRSALVDECDLPLLESVVDLALVVHGLEFADTPDDMLHEVWRVLAPQGRLLLAIPNRRGIWAASERTPFGHGQPFSRSQVATLLKDAKFAITRWDTALYFPPLQARASIALARSAETAGRLLASRFAGVTIVEAVKQVYAFSSGKRARRLVPRFRPVLLPAPRRLAGDRAIPVPKNQPSGL